MSERERERRSTLLEFIPLLREHPGLCALMGFLVGNLERVHLVRSLEGAEGAAAIRLSARRRPIWPHRPFVAQARGVPIPDPLLLIAALSEGEDAIFLQLDTDEPAVAARIQEQSAEGPAAALYGEGAEDDPADRRQELRERLDRALDIYNECRRLSATAGPERAEELSRFREMAKQEMEVLSRALSAISRAIGEQ